MIHRDLDLRFKRDNKIQSLIMGISCTDFVHRAPKYHGTWENARAHSNRSVISKRPRYSNDALGQAQKQLDHLKDLKLKLIKKKNDNNNGGIQR